jgi:hypothetical protein
MPCDCFPSHFDVRSHSNISYIDIIGVDLLVAFQSFPLYAPAKDIWRGSY